MNTEVRRLRTDSFEAVENLFENVQAHHIGRPEELKALGMSAHDAKVQVLCEMFVEVRVNKLSDEQRSALFQDTLGNQSIKGDDWSVLCVVRKKYEETLEWLNELPE